MCFVTLSKRTVDLSNLKVEDIDIQDIAHALSQLCRFSGQCQEFYSVAQHSVQVAHTVPRHLALQGLLHDAAEAYLGDVSRPLKALLPDYKKLEDRAWLVIAERFGLPDILDPQVKIADNRALRTEWMQLIPASQPEWIKGYELLPPVRPLPPTMARNLFLSTYYLLGGNNGS